MTQELLITRVRNALSARGMSLTNPEDLVALEKVITEVLDEYQRRAAAGGGLSLRDVEATRVRIRASVVGYGPLDDLFKPGGNIEDIWIEGEHVRYLEQGRVRVMSDPMTEAEVLRVIQSLLTETNSALNRGHPVLGGIEVLGGRGRLTAAVPPMAPWLSAHIRLPVVRYADLELLEVNDTLSPAAAALLGLDVQAKGSILIAGETGSGKSTLLAALLAAARPNHNVRLLEESQELQFRPGHGGRVQCVEGVSGCSDLGELVVWSLRVKPDIIAVGEVRDEAAWQLARASSVGAGFLATIHANSAGDALEALVLTSLGAGPNISESLIRRRFGRSIHFVAFCERDDPNLLGENDPYRHQVTEIRVVTPLMDEARGFSSEVVFERPGGLGGELIYTGVGLPEALTVKLEKLLPPYMSLNDVLWGKADPRQ